MLVPSAVEAQSREEDAQTRRRRADRSIGRSYCELRLLAFLYYYGHGRSVLCRVVLCELFSVKSVRRDVLYRECSTKPCSMRLVLWTVLYEACLEIE